MKKIVSIIVFVLFTGILSAQTSGDAILMTVDGQKITKSEFEYIYFKNNNHNTVDPKTLDEYVELFKKFKLKVIDAERHGMDTLPSFRYELEGYRGQLAKPYLIDTEVEEALYKEAYEHLLQDVEVCHVLLKLPENYSDADTLKVYNRALTIRKRLQTEDFGQVALETSEDPSVQNNRGYLGFFTGLMTVYAFEQAMYSIPVGEISAPVRTPYGYHIIKVLSRRPARGQVRAAHIVKIASDKKTPEEQEAARQQILNLYKQIKDGADFADLAKTQSDDKPSAARGGDLSWFGIGRMVKEFEDAVFALENIGDVSEPVRTGFGWHIIKLLDKRPVGAFAEKKGDIQRAMQYDGRANKGKEALLARLKQEYHWTEDVAVWNEVLTFAQSCGDIDSTFATKITTLTKPLFSFADRVLTQNHFLRYVSATSDYGMDALSLVEASREDFIEKEILNYENTRLEEKYPDFRYLVQEYHDGILLFNISNEFVWNRAITDTKGLQAYFEANRNQYAWEKPHFKGYVFYCKDKQVAKELRKTLKTLPQDSIMAYLHKQLNADSVFAEATSGLWQQGEDATIDRLVFKVKDVDVKAPEYLPEAFVHGKILAKLPESYTDVKGLVTSDYQNYLEEEWLKTLFEKYPIVVDEAVLKTIRPAHNGH
ncbi:MAG: peptidylprolyl isomerase [Prevotellaceae bacterium]|nr:peptidylprolyl isomerase [Prevotellaceae bacterium]